MNVLDGIFNLFSQNWYIVIGLIGLLLFLGMMLYGKSMIKPDKEILYFSEAERLLEYIKVIELTPKQVKCEGNKRFHRRTLAYLAIKSGKPVTTFLGKRGLGYTFKPEDTPPKKAFKLGSIYDGIVNVLGDDVVSIMLPEHIKSLKDSNVFVTVELERSSDKDLPSITETDVYSTGNMNMANLVGERVANALAREDWIRNAGLVGIGVALTYVAQNMGIL